jgi:hypothetical protein
MKKSEIYQKALKWGIESYPESSDIHHRAFASVVQFACTGQNRIAVIKTMRTLVAMDILYLYKSETLSFNEAINMFKDACYGDITIAHAQKWKHDRPEKDDENDIQKAKQILEIPLEGIYRGKRDY